jgi:hypothetical protein
VNLVTLVKPSPSLRSARPQIVKDLAHLSPEVAFANQFAGFVDRELAGDEYQFRSFGPGNMTIRTQRFG